MIKFRDKWYSGAINHLSRGLERVGVPRPAWFVRLRLYLCVHGLQVKFPNSSQWEYVRRTHRWRRTLRKEAQCA